MAPALHDAGTFGLMRIDEQFILPVQAEVDHHQPEGVVPLSPGQPSEHPLDLALQSAHLAVPRGVARLVVDHVQDRPAGVVLEPVRH
jgi:hypothetical protein